MTCNDYPGGNPGYNLYVLYVRHLQDFSSDQPIKVMFDFRPAVPAATSLIGYALLLTNEKNQFPVTVIANLI